MIWTAIFFSLYIKKLLQLNTNLCTTQILLFIFYVLFYVYPINKKSINQINIYKFVLSLIRWRDKIYKEQNKQIRYKKICFVFLCYGIFPIQNSKLLEI